MHYYALAALAALALGALALGAPSAPAPRNFFFAHTLEKKVAMASDELEDAGVAGAQETGLEWAHETWKFIHRFSFYVDMHEFASADAQAAFHDILRNLPRVLPCDDCRGHMAAYLAQHPLPLPQCAASCEFANARYCVDLHNSVNIRQGKPTVPFEVVHAQYTGEAAPPACPTGSSIQTSTGSVPRSRTKTSPALVAVAITVVVLVLLMGFVQICWIVFRRRR